MGVKEETAEIRKHIKKRVPTVSVKMGRGSAHGYVSVDCGTGWEFTVKERKVLKSLGLTLGRNTAIISPEERKKLAARLKKK